MSELSMRLIIEAENRATDEIRKTRAGMDEVSTSGAGAEKVFSQLTGTTKTFVAQLAGSFNPALGQMASGLTTVAKGAGAMGLAVSGVAAALVVVGAAAAKYIETLDAIATRQAALNMAVKALDFGSIKSGALEAARDMEKLLLQMNDPNIFQQWIAGTRVFTNNIGLTRTAMDDLVRSAEALGKVFPVERARMMAEALTSQYQAMIQLRSVALGRAENLSDITGYRQHMGAIRQDLSGQFTQEETVIRNRYAGQIGEATALGEKLGVEKGAPYFAVARALEQRRDIDIKALSLRASTAFGALDETERRFLAGKADQYMSLDIAAGSTAEQIGLGPTYVEGVAGYAGRQARILDRLSIGRDRAQAYTGIFGLSPQQYDALNLSAIESERRRAVQENYKDPDRQDLANLQAQINAGNVVRAGGERDNAGLGLARGFRDAADEAEQSGRVLQEFARNTAKSMQQSFSDNFFAVITGDFKKLPDLGRAFAMSMVRNITDALATMATAPILRGVSNALGGGVSGLPFGNFAGAAAGVMPRDAAGAAMPIQLSGPGVSDQAARLQAEGYSIVTTGTGVVAMPPSTPGFGVPSISPGMLGDVTSGTALGEFLKSPLFKQPASVSVDTLYQQALARGFSPEEAALYADQAAMAAQTGTLPNLTVGGALGIGLGAAAFGFTLYNALTGPPTTQNIVTSAVSGAVTGYSLGATIGVAIGAGAGVGGIYGAIAGALIGAGAAALGKGGDEEKEKADRQKREIDRSGGQIRAVVQAVQKSKTIQELFDYLNRRAPGGPSDTGWGQWINVKGALKLMAGPGRSNTVTLDEFIKYIDTYQVAIQAGVDVNLLIQWNEALAGAVRGKVSDLLDKSKRGVFAVRDSLPGGLGRDQGGIERLTIYTGASRIDEAAGKDIFASVDALRFLGLDDDTIEQLIRKLKSVDRDRNVGLIQPDELLFV